MTKKILALALAGTTAFSVFAGALSVNAAEPTIYDDAYAEYTPVTLKVTAGNEFDNGSNIKVFAGLFNFDGADQTIEASTEAVVYAFDYARFLPDKDDAKLKKFEGMIAAAAAEKKYDIDGNGTEDVVTNTELLTAFRAAYTFTPATGTAGNVSPETKLTVGDGATAARANAIYDLNKIYNDNIKKYTESTSTDGSTISVKELSDVYDELDVKGYKLKELFDDIVTAAGTNSSLYTSEALYLVQEYNRIVSLLNGADTTNVIDDYDELYAQLLERSEEDYTATNWKKFQRALEDAEDLADEAAKAGTIAKWKEALKQLQAADAVEAIAGKYIDLQNALLALYTDGKLTSLNGNARYDIDGAKSVYLAADYMETNMYGRREPSAAYAAAFIDTVKTTNDKGEATSYHDDSAYTKAYKVWNEARKYGAKVAQSKINSVLAELQSAIDALDPTSSAPNYQMVLLETAVENVSGYVDTDYNATSRKYKDFAAALDKAEAVLAKANSSASEVLTAFKKLAETASALSSVTKSVPAALQQDLREAINSASVSLKEMDSKQGAQYVALQEALAFARYVQGNEWKGDDISYDGKKYDFKSKSTISDYNAAIDELENAVNGFNQILDWYVDAEGNDHYGTAEGDYNDGWHKIDGLWFFFNDKGVALKNQWVEADGKWSWVGSNCVCYRSSWIFSGGHYYYVDQNGYMLDGEWLGWNGGWYWLDKGGRMATGWRTIGNKQYYFGTDGAMLSNTITPDGYEVGVDGAYIQK